MWTVFTELVRTGSNILVRVKTRLFYRWVKLIIEPRAYVHHSSEIKSSLIVGTGTYINGPLRVVGSAGAKIGKYCAIGSGVRIITSNHELSKPNLQVRFGQHYFGQNIDQRKRETSIGNNVWIGDLAIILPGVQIGDGAVIGAGAVVTKNVEPFSIVVGNPAKLVRYRFGKQARAVLTKVQWWNWSEEKIRRHKKFFLQELI